ncbi:MAG: hypothetical protein HFACDABA_01097 [Anaerolineales bacterium]|nr:hypothetical protein [Anaerolineales bacterium]
MPALATHFPPNDGGMFYDMTRDLQASQYRLPAVASYNGLDLPYAYPPLGFYLAALLSDLGRIPLLDLFLWLPAWFAVLAIPAFYLLARALLTDDLRAALATLFFALTPGSYFWRIMGGGMTRAPGLLFILLSVYFVHRIFTSEAHQPEENKKRVRLIAFAILSCTCAVLSHPEVAVHTASLCALLWLFFGRSRRGTLDAALIALGVTLFTSPWWLTVISQNGFAPFLSAAQTGLHANAQWVQVILDGFSAYEFIPILFVLRVVGFLYAFWKKQYFLLAMIFVPVFVDPRSAEAVSFLAFCILSASVLLDLLPPVISRLTKKPLMPLLDSRAGAALTIVLVFLLFLQSGLRNYSLINSTLNTEQRETMEWLRVNLPPGQNFFLLTGQRYSMSDPVQEWFPTLTGQHSQTTLQGLEWTLGPQFTQRLNDLTALQACAEIACVELWSARTNLAYDYLWLTKATTSFESALASDNYSLVYESESLAIFARQK